MLISPSIIGYLKKRVRVLCLEFKHKMCDGTKQLFLQTKYVRKYQLKQFLLGINNFRGN